MELADKKEMDDTLKNKLLTMLDEFKEYFANEKSYSNLQLPT